MSTRGLARNKNQEFRALISAITQKLQNSNALEDLKYQSKDYIALGKREQITSFWKLFTVWEELDLVHADETTFLAQCLGNIHRQDLVKLVKRYEAKKLELLVEQSTKTV